MVILRVIILLILLLPASSFAATGDYFDWATRTDRDGKAAGYYAATPFPVTESSTEYSITNDEGTTTFSLGTKYYVAKTGSDAGANDCKTFATPCLTIGYAITQTEAGVNQTIIVRAGTYEESNLTLKSGGDATNRSMIIGYNQEIPVIDAGGGTNPIFQSHNTTNGHWTFQRLKLTNVNNDCMYFGTDASKKEHDIYVIDVEATACPNGLKQGDGSIYMMNVDNVWINHVTAHRSAGHCIKIGDDADTVKVEWTKAYECGYWSTMVDDLSITDWVTDSNAHPSGLDFPSDSGEDGQNYTVRYNIVYDTLFYGVQLRNTSNFSFHHNEVYNTAHWDDVPGVSCAVNGVSTCPQVLLMEYGGGFLSGGAYSNYIRDSTDAETSGIGVNGLATGKTINIYNNIIDSNHVNGIYLRGYPLSSGRVINVWNNSIYHSHATNPAINAETNWAAGEVTIKGNIIHQAGAGPAVAFDADIAKSYNLYYYPSGSRGYADPLETGGVVDNPDWSAAPPWGAYDPGDGNLASDSPAIDKFTTADAPTGTFTKDFNLTSRPVGTKWDIGAFEYDAPAGSWLVTPSVSGEGCTISPATAITVTDNNTTELTLTVSSGYHLTGYTTGTGHCGGSGTTTFVTNPVTAEIGDCQVVANCRSDKGSMTAGTGGSIVAGTGGSIAF